MNTQSLGNSTAQFRQLSRLVVFPILLISCQPRSLSATELQRYAEDPANGLAKELLVDSTKLTVTYQPVDLMVARSLHDQPHPDPSAVDSIRRKYQNYAFFLLSISRNNREILQPQEGFGDYSSLLQTLSFQMGDYTQVTTSRGDTLKVNNYYLDRTYANGEASQLLFAFPSIPHTGDWRFHLREFGLGTGDAVFQFEASAVTATPQLLVD